MLLIVLLSFFIAQSAAAENTPALDFVSGDFKEMKHSASAKVDKVIDAQTILMKDGKIIRLLGIDYPFMAGDMEGGPALPAKARLEKLLSEGTDVMLYQNKNREAGRLNRMGHVLAHLVIKEKGISKSPEIPAEDFPGAWINGMLVREGLAWTMTDATNPQMATQLYALEDKARKDGKGLWGEQSPFKLLTPENAAQGNGTFRVVEGTVNRAASSKNNLYLNFGSDMKKDFTVMLSPALRKALARKGVEPMGLGGQKVRVRGWLREWNGPFIELETIERIEILSTELPTEPSTSSPQ